MTRMVDGVITSSGDAAGHVHPASEMPILGGLVSVGVHGTSPGGMRSGSLYAVRSPVFTTDEPIALLVDLDWSEAEFIGADPAEPVLRALVNLHDGVTGEALEVLRYGSYAVTGTVGGGGHLMAIATVAEGTYYVSGSFRGMGSAAAGDYWVGGDQEIQLSVRPQRAGAVVAAYGAQRSDDVITVFDLSEGAIDTTIIWGEDDAYDSMTAGAAASYVHTDQQNALALLIASDTDHAVGVRAPVGDKLTWDDVDGALTWDAVNPITTWDDAASAADL